MKPDTLNPVLTIFKYPAVYFFRKNIFADLEIGASGVYISP